MGANKGAFVGQLEEAYTSSSQKPNIVNPNSDRGLIRNERITLTDEDVSRAVLGLSYLIADSFCALRIEEYGGRPTKLFWLYWCGYTSFRYVMSQSYSYRPLSLY